MERIEIRALRKPIFVTTFRALRLPSSRLNELQDIRREVEAEEEKKRNAKTAAASAVSMLCSSEEENTEPNMQLQLDRSNKSFSRPNSEVGGGVDDALTCSRLNQT